MNLRRLVLAAALGSGMVAVLGPSPAHAQSTTTGAIQGQIFDDATGEPLAGVTVVVTAPVLQAAQTAISDEDGVYKIAELPPGSYLVTFYVARLVIERRGITVG